MRLKRLTTNEFIEKAKLVHGERYDYSLVNYANTKTKIKIICKEHGIFEQSPNGHLSGRNCSKCGNICRNDSIRKSTKQFIEKANLVHGGRYDYSLVDYKSSNVLVKIICKDHGIFEQSPHGHLNGSGCPECGMISRSNIRRKSLSEFIEKAKLIHNNIYDYSLVDYVNAATKVKIICKEHGVFEQSPQNHLCGGGCLKCSYVLRGEMCRITHDEFIKRSNKLHNNIYDYSLVEYKNKDKRVKIICKEHGIFEQIAGHHLRGSGCPKCSQIIHGNNLRLTTDEFIEKAKLLHNDIYDYSLVDYTRTIDKIEIICPKHGIFEQKPNSHLCGTGCPKCVTSISVSKSEQEVYDYCGTLVHNAIQSDRTILKPKELDIYLPDQKLAIEYNGMYWHSSNNVEKDKVMKDYHSQKTLDCEKLGVQLFHIFENEWLCPNKKEIWKSVISNALGKSNKIYARKCSITKLTMSDAKEFCDKNHLQSGNAIGSIAYGLIYDNELVSIMTFGKARYSKADYELIRFCNKLNYSVIGGASKLLTNFRKYNKGSIISYANRRWSNGNLYRKLGFTETHISEPCYYYFKMNENKIYHRSSFMKHKLKDKLPIFDENLSEVDNMYNNEYFRIWDCGNYVFKLE